MSIELLVTQELCNPTMTLVAAIAKNYKTYDLAELAIFNFCVFQLLTRVNSLSPIPRPSTPPVFDCLQSIFAYCK